MHRRRGIDKHGFKTGKFFQYFFQLIDFVFIDELCLKVRQT